VAGVWDWFCDHREASGYLEKLAEAVEKGWLIVPSPESVARHARILAAKVREFHYAYSDYGEGLILGYFVIIHDTMRVEALVARGENEPRLEIVNVEDWLAEYKSSMVVHEIGG
jgi:hypothetical protein